MVSGVCWRAAKPHQRIEFSGDLAAGTLSRIFRGTKRGLTVRVDEHKKL